MLGDVPAGNREVLRVGADVAVEGDGGLGGHVRSLLSVWVPVQRRPGRARGERSPAVKTAHARRRLGLAAGRPSGSLCRDVGQGPRARGERGRRGPPALGTSAWAGAGGFEVRAPQGGGQRARRPGGYEGLARSPGGGALERLARDVTAAVGAGAALGSRIEEGRGAQRPWRSPACSTVSNLTDMVGRNGSVLERGDRLLDREQRQGRRRRDDHPLGPLRRLEGAHRPGRQGGPGQGRRPLPQAHPHQGRRAPHGRRARPRKPHGGEAEGPR